MEQLAPIIIAAVLTFTASVIAAYLLRRTGKESNTTNTFDVVTDKLFDMIKLADERIDGLEQEIAELKAERKENRKVILEYEGRVETLEGEVETLRVVNGRLSRYVGKLVQAWPQGEHLPEPDEPVAWGE